MKPPAPETSRRCGSVRPRCQVWTSWSARTGQPFCDVDMSGCLARSGRLLYGRVTDWSMELACGSCCDNSPPVRLGGETKAPPTPHEFREARRAIPPHPHRSRRWQYGYDREPTLALAKGHPISRGHAHYERKHMQADDLANARDFRIDTPKKASDESAIVPFGHVSEPA